MLRFMFNVINNSHHEITALTWIQYRRNKTFISRSFPQNLFLLYSFPLFIENTLTHANYPLQNKRYKFEKCWFFSIFFKEQRDSLENPCLIRNYIQFIIGSKFNQELKIRVLKSSLNRTYILSEILSYIIGFKTYCANNIKFHWKINLGD